MSADVRLIHSNFPRSNAYHPDWVLKNGMGSNPLWLAEWLSESLELNQGMRVLDLGCGRAASSIFLAREFGLQVWATDLWVAAGDNASRISDAGCGDQIFPIHADARALPFAGEFFDAIVCLDSFPYYGTDALYLNYLAHFVQPGGTIAIANAGLVREVADTGVPEHLKSWWSQDLWALQTAEWWRKHWARTGIVTVELAETMVDGWKQWVAWQRAMFPDGTPEIDAIETDAGRTIGYVRVVARRNPDVKLEDYAWPDNMKTLLDDYEARPLLRG